MKTKLSSREIMLGCISLIIGLLFLTSRFIRIGDSTTLTLINKGSGTLIWLIFILISLYLLRQPAKKMYGSILLILSLIFSVAYLFDFIRLAI
ncbi:hypothetical protein DX130_16950 [Paenibacillus paeoniae]|uniref:Uncharacterized protein n=1 Tax=Paenibacillus paeoniae TaxID=2292705 RepID=A0A371PE61_9BACL|nr:hypothetical protein DX130_16950 [Paenibacillus paeoniae]